MKFLDRRYRELLAELIMAEHKVRDQSSFLGLLWSFLHPVMTMAVLFVFFSLNAGRDIPHYALYLLVGLVHYTHFTNSTGAGMVVLSSMRSLTRDTVFPKELMVIATVFASSTELLVSLVFCLAVAALTSVRLGWLLVLLPGLVVLHIAMTLWISLLLATLYVFVQDIGHLYQVFLRMLLFITPIFYRPDYLAPGLARELSRWNPLGFLIGMSRSAIMGQPKFPAGSFVVFLLVNLLLVRVSLAVFRRCEGEFAGRV